MNSKNSFANRFDPSKKGKPGTLSNGLHVVRFLVVLFVALNVLLLYGIFFSSQGILGYRQQTAQVAELEKKIAELKRKNHKLFNKIQSFKKDPQAQERLVRQQLGWAKENELMIEFVTPEKADAQ